MSKRHAVALMLAAVMATLLPVSIFSDSNDPASSVQGNETTASTSDPEDPMSAALGSSGEDVNVEAMNSVGGYMVNVMNEQNKEKARNDALTAQEKYSIVTAEFDPESGVLYVGSTQPASCKIQARFLSDDDPKRESACVEATAEKGKDIVTTLNVDTNSLPEYYTIEIDLCFFTGNIKLCDTYVISDFTQQMQEIYATTIEDFEPEYVVNLDQNEDTNFMVLNENTIVADSTDTSNTLVSADYENGVFTFDNADETLSELKKDDYFYIQPNENDMIAVIVGDVMVEDDTVTITKSDSDQGDMFDFIKVEATPGMSDDEMVVEHLEDGVTVDDNQADEFMMSEDFVPIVGSSDETQASFYNLGPLTYHPAINLSLDMGFDKESGDENYELSGKLKGSVGISFGYGFNFYKSFSYINLQVKLPTCNGYIDITVIWCVLDRIIQNIEQCFTCPFSIMGNFQIFRTLNADMDIFLFCIQQNPS